MVKCMFLFYGKMNRALRTSILRFDAKIEIYLSLKSMNRFHIYIEASGSTMLLNTLYVVGI